MPLLLALLLAVALAVAPTPARAAVPPLHGLQITSVHAGMAPAAIDRDLDVARSVGANVVRAEVRWAELEPTRGTVDEAYAALVDHLAAAARARGMKVLMTLVGTPCWNTRAPAPAEQCRTPQERAEAGRWQPRDLAAYARIAALAARRWERDLAALELWNEPDHANEQYWAGDDKVARYARLVKLAYPAIKAASPRTTVLAGAIVGYNGAFLKALYREGMRGNYDGLSVHYYDLVLYSLGQIRAVRKKAGDKKPLWLAEFGWTSCRTSGAHRQEGGHLCVTPAVQAQNTVDVLASLGRARDVRASILFAARDDDRYDFGVLDRAGNPKPLLADLARAYGGKRTKPRRLTLRLRRAGRRLVASGVAPAGDAYAVYAFKSGKLRYSVVFRPRRDQRYKLRLSPKLGTRGVAVVVRPVSTNGRDVTRFA